LFPWANRIRDGLWQLDGEPQQLPINEPELHNALHGLVTDKVFTVLHSQRDTVTLRALVSDAPGYPFHMQLDITYTAKPHCISVNAVVSNVGQNTAPFALGFHPYLRLGDVPTDELELQLQADTVLDTDARLLPTGQHPVAGTELDPHRLALDNATLDNCFGDLTTQDGKIRHRVGSETLGFIELSADPVFRWVQTYLCPAFPREGGTTAKTIAVEPMTAPPDALNSGIDLIWLPAGENWAATWELRLIPQIK
ncbi:MAG: hypothetical protein LBC29_06135, partial [Propionibacteriaceae bacterium]|jgi:aldose 1-epimerase|nr:hypothetical protein [Propionibacteriaceae bacterium]